MKDKKIHTGIDDIRKINLTGGEKERMLKTILDLPLPAKSPWGHIFFLKFKSHRASLYVVASCLVLLLAGASVVSASSTSLPGDALYAFKVKVVEPMHSVFAFSPRARAEYASMLATLRLTEAETLAHEDKLDTLKETELSSLLMKHTNAFNQALVDGTDANDDIVTNFRAQMNAHARVLDALRLDRDADTNETGDATDNDDNQISDLSNVARSSSSDVHEKNRHFGTDDNTDKYSKRKKFIQDLIDHTADKLDEAHQESDATSWRNKTFINDTESTLGQARDLLKEADDDADKGDKMSAYSKLSDSESSAKEADIFLSTGFKFKGNMRDK